MAVWQNFIILSTADHHTFCWKWEENQNKLFSEAHTEAASNTS